MIAFEVRTEIVLREFIIMIKRAAVLKKKFYEDLMRSLESFRMKFFTVITDEILLSLTTEENKIYFHHLKFILHFMLYKNLKAFNFSKCKCNVKISYDILADVESSYNFSPKSFFSYYHECVIYRCIVYCSYKEKRRKKYIREK